MLTHQLLEAPGVAHHSHLMYGSPCGLRVLLDVEGCKEYQP